MFIALTSQTCEFQREEWVHLHSYNVTHVEKSLNVRGRTTYNSWELENIYWWSQGDTSRYGSSTIEIGYGIDYTSKSNLSVT
jgi:hypothetical protein